jgi:hypothetical protein
MDENKIATKYLATQPLEKLVELLDDGDFVCTKCGIVDECHSNGARGEKGGGGERTELIHSDSL